MGRLFHEQVAKDQPLDLGAQKTADGILRAADDRFLYIERGVEKHRHAGESAECREKIIESGIGLSRHRLHARRPIHMCHGGDDPFRGRLDPHRKLHKGGSGRQIEKLLGSLVQYRWRKGSKGFAAFHFAIDQFSHIFPARIR